MAKHKTVFFTLAFFSVASLIVVYVELEFNPKSAQDEPSHLEVAEEWKKEEELHPRARHVLAPRQEAGLGVGRVLAKYDLGKSEQKAAFSPAPSELVGAVSLAKNLRVLTVERDEKPTVLLSQEVEDQRAKAAQQGVREATQLKGTSVFSRIERIEDKLHALSVLKQMQLRLDAGTRELWWYLRNLLKGASNPEKPQSSEQEQLLGYIKEQIDLLACHATDVQNIADSLISDGWRENMFANISGLLQRRLHYLQNPKDCASAKKLLCRISKPCGFGCQMHHTAYCFVLAYATQRMLIVDASKWRYARSWEAAFQPVSSHCPIPQNISLDQVREWDAYSIPNPPEIIEADIVEKMAHPPPPFMPMAIPRDLADQLKSIHGYPFVWFLGQLLYYLMRPSDTLSTYLQTSREKMGFRHPIVGVHVRRSDKIHSEAAFHPLSEYMTQVEEWYQARETQGLQTEAEMGKKRAVYLATDDPLLIEEAHTKYPNYEFVTDNDVSKIAGNMLFRYTQDGLFGVIMDVMMLSDCDYIVCTFSSQVCRLAYELMQTKHFDASRSFYSLDDVYYFGGQQAHYVKTFHANSKPHKGQVPLEKEDKILIAGNEKNGFSVGTVRKYNRRGMFPSYKVEEEIRVADFPTYPEVL